MASTQRAGDLQQPSASDAPADEKPKSGEAQEALLRLARDRFRMVCESESELRQQQRFDKEFKAGRQWNEQEAAARKRDKRPSLTINRMPSFVRQITGQARQNRPEIEIAPVDDFGDPETAEVLQGIVKHVETTSHAQSAYDTALEDAVVMGRGFLRLVTEYCDDLSFDLDIKIKRVRNSHQVYFDPRCVEIDYSDASFAFFTTDYSTEEFKRRFPKADMSKVSDEGYDGAIGDDKQYWWLDGETIRVAEYYYVDYKDVTAARLSDGRDLVIEEAQKAVAESVKEIEAQIAAIEQQLQKVAAFPGTPPPQIPQIPEPLSIVKTRPAKQRIVKWAKITGTQVLKEGTWPGKYIPLIPVVGEEIDLGGKIDLRGIVRDMRDQQRAYNFMVSSLVETIMLAPKAPWVIAAGQLKGHEKYWKTANTQAWSYLPYEGVSSNGTYAPPPQRQTFEPAIAAIVAAISQHDNDMKAVTGLWDASLGKRGPEQSGVAIQQRQQQGEIGQIHFPDNLSRSLWALGRQLLDLIPKIYDVPRVIRITGNDEKKRSVMVHAGRDEDVPQMLPEGVKKVYDLSVGRYDVVVGSGPGPQTRRQEAVMMMTQAIQANPDLLNIIGDLYFNSMDWPKARQIADRLKKVIPQANDEDNSDDPAVMQAKLGQLQQQLMERTMQLKQASEDLKTDKIKAIYQKEVALLNAKVELIKLRMTLAASEKENEQKIDLAHQQAAIKFASDERAHTRDLEAQGEQFRQKTEAEDRRTQMTLAATRQDKDADRALQSADTILQAELANLEGERAEAEGERVRTEQRDEAAAQRSFEGQQGDADRQFQGQQGEAERAFQAETGEAERAFQAAQAEAARKAEAKKPKPGGKA